MTFTWIVLASSSILLAAFGVAQLSRRQSAGMRHSILAAGLVGSIVVPAASVILPVRTVVAPPMVVTEVLQEAPQLEAFAPGIVTPDSPRGPKLSIQQVWVAGIFTAVVVLLIRAGWIVRTVWRSKPCVDSRWTDALREISPSFKLKRRVRLLLNDASVLGTWGFLRPRIFLPMAASSWPDERVRVVLMHELAHIARWDWPVQMFAEFARAIYWFNPLFWILLRRLRFESEHACDDVVLHAGVDSKDYAAHLLDLARNLKDGRAASPVIAMSGSIELERRFVAMFNASLNHRPASLRALAAMCFIAILVTLPAAAMQPRETLEAFQVLSAPPAPRVVQVAAVPESPRQTPPPPRPVTPAPVTPQGRADGELSGTVSDPTAAVLPGVLVSVWTAATTDGLGLFAPTQVASGVTDEAGRFSLRGISPGVYSLRAELPGFRRFEKGGIEIRSSQNTSQNVFMALGSIAQAVVVSAQAPEVVTPPSSTQPVRIRVGGVVSAPNLISSIRPIYPASARDAGIEGVVHLQATIGTDGSLVGVRVVSSDHPSLVGAAVEAVKQWRYRPAMLNGDPTEMPTEIAVTFALDR